LDYNFVYSILYKKEGCKDKIVIVDTRIPQGLKRMSDNTHEFEIELSQKFVRQTIETEDFPVAILFIDKHEKMLVLCESYHEFMHREDVYALNSN